MPLGKMLKLLKINPEILVSNYALTLHNPTLNNIYFSSLKYFGSMVQISLLLAALSKGVCFS